MANKLRNKAGETISETLVALLIAALALVMLAGAISAASHMVTNSRNRLNGYYDKNEEPDGVVLMSSSTDSGTLTIAGNDSDPTISASVSIYQNTEFGDNSVIAYKKSE